MTRGEESEGGLHHTTIIDGVLVNDEHTGSNLLSNATKFRKIALNQVSLRTGAFTND